MALKSVHYCACVGTTKVMVTIPEWQRELIDKDASKIGSGSRNQGGVQAVVMFSLGMYFSMPNQQREYFARMSLPATAPQSDLQDKLDRMWPIQVLKLLSEASEADRETIFVHAKALLEASRAASPKLEGDTARTTV